MGKINQRPVEKQRCDNCSRLECLTFEAWDLLVCMISGAEVSAAGACEMWSDARVKEE